MKYKIITGTLSYKLEEKVQEKLDLGWELHGSMTHILYEKDVVFYQPMILHGSQKRIN